jgi:hypothetical protein
VKVLLVVIVVACDLEDVIQLEVGHEHRAHPVMDQSAAHFLRILTHRTDDDLSAVDFGGALGVFKCPEEAATGAEPVLKICTGRLQVVIPGGDGFGF